MFIVISNVIRPDSTIHVILCCRQRFTELVKQIDPKQQLDANVEEVIYSDPFNNCSHHLTGILLQF